MRASNVFASGSRFMSPQDSQLQQEFLDQLVQARGVAKDPEAEGMIQRAVARQPDAAYLLVQRALLQQQALNNARAEIDALQAQLRAAPQAAPAFLDPNAWGNSGTARSPAAPSYQQPYQPPYQQPYPGQMQPAGGFLRGGFGGTLGNIAATAAGVAGGAFLFQGLENLLGHHSGNGFLGSQSALAPPTESPSHHEAAASSNESMAHKLGGDSMLGSGADTASTTSNGLADTFGSDFDDTSQDDGLFS
jgi:hypothetical protein